MRKLNRTMMMTVILRRAGAALATLTVENTSHPQHFRKNTSMVHSRVSRASPHPLTHSALGAGRKAPTETLSPRGEAGSVLPRLPSGHGQTRGKSQSNMKLTASDILKTKRYKPKRFEIKVWERRAHIQAHSCTTYNSQEADTQASTNRRMDKMWSLPTTECYSAFKRKDILNHATTRGNLEDVLLVK